MPPPDEILGPQGLAVKLSSTSSLHSETVSEKETLRT